MFSRYLAELSSRLSAQSKSVMAEKSNWIFDTSRYVLTLRESECTQCGRRKTTPMRYGVFLSTTTENAFHIQIHEHKSDEMCSGDDVGYLAPFRSLWTARTPPPPHSSSYTYIHLSNCAVSMDVIGPQFASACRIQGSDAHPEAGTTSRQIET